MDGWLSIYSAALSALALLVSMAQKNVSRRAAVDEEQGTTVLFYTPGLQRIAALAAIVTVAVFAMALLDWPTPVAPEYPAVGITFVGAVAAAVIRWAMVLRRRVVLDRDGLVLATGFGGEHAMSWTDIRKVTFRNGSFVLRGSEGRPLKINVAMNGIKSLIAAMDAMLPRKIYIGSVSDYNNMKRHMPHA